jgi:hypothetical protein
MKKHHYLLNYQGTLKLWVSETEKPFQPDENGVMSFFGTEKELELAEKEWLSTSKSFDFANKENEDKFKEFVFSIISNRKNMPSGFVNEFSIAYTKYVSKGVLIPEEYVKIFVATDGPRKGQSLVYFNPPIIAAPVEETQDELWRYAEKICDMYKDSSYTTVLEQLKLKFTLTRK